MYKRQNPDSKSIRERRGGGSGGSQYFVFSFLDDKDQRKKFIVFESLKKWMIINVMIAKYKK